jgi:hypothetical protein
VAWTVVCTFKYRPWTGSIKPSLQQFNFGRVGLSLGILYLSILWSHPCYLCRVAAVKSIPVHLINDVIFSILEDRSARHYCCACGIFSFNFSAFLVGWFQYSYLNNVESPLGYVACFLNLSFGVLSVIRRLHGLWSPFGIPFFVEFRPLFSRSGHTHFFNLGPYIISWNGTTVSHWRFHDNRHMNTSGDVSKFKILLFHV